LKTIFLHIILLIVFSASAQKEDLKKLNAKLDDVFRPGTGLHMQYSLTVRGGESGKESDSMIVDMIKESNGDYKIVMGKARTLLRVNKMVLQVNDIDKLIVMEEDTNKVVDDHTLFMELTSLMDSARTITFAKEKHELVYTLSFGADFMYRFIQFKFSSKTQLPSGIYAEFNQGGEDAYHSLSATYTVWDLKWKDKKNELQLNRFVELKNNRYEGVAAYSNYQVFKPEHGPINIDFK